MSKIADRKLTGFDSHRRWHSCQLPVSFFAEHFCDFGQFGGPQVAKGGQKVAK